MNRIKYIVNHPLYLSSLKEIERLEQDREFCRHTMEHYLDVARIAYLFNLEQGAGYAKDVIYGAALLHDIGRGLQYTKGIPHEIASRQLAAELLIHSQFTAREQALILDAVGSHRKKTDSQDLNGILYRADKQSRTCFACKAEKRCDWPLEKKNMELLY